ncbi:hypothetical protein BH20VER3_BH20VER3_05800 [soil metagenome]
MLARNRLRRIFAARAPRAPAAVRDSVEPRPDGSQGQRHIMFINPALLLLGKDALAQRVTFAPGLDEVSHHREHRSPDDKRQFAVIFQLIYA